MIPMIRGCGMVDFTVSVLSYICWWIKGKSRRGNDQNRLLTYISEKLYDKVSTLLTRSFLLSFRSVYIWISIAKTSNSNVPMVLLASTVSLRCCIPSLVGVGFWLLIAVCNFVMIYSIESQSVVVGVIWWLAWKDELFHIFAREMIFRRTKSTLNQDSLVQVEHTLFVPAISWPTSSLFWRSISAWGISLQPTCQVDTVY